VRDVNKDKPLQASLVHCLELLDNDTIAAEERLAKAIESKIIPSLVLWQFAYDCAARALEAEQQAQREPDRASVEALRLIEEWFEQRSRTERASEPEEPNAGRLFSSIGMADAILKRRFGLSARLAAIAIDARKAIDQWEAKAPLAAAEAAALAVEMVAESAAAEDDAQREWQAEERWTDMEIEWAMQAAASRGPGAWSAKSEMDSGAIAKRLVERQAAAAIHGAREVSRRAANRAWEHAAQKAQSSDRGSWSFGRFLRSFWAPKDSAAVPNAPENESATIAESSRMEEVAWQIADLRELIERIIPPT
jgi:hypothetical protein